MKLFTLFATFITLVSVSALPKRHRHDWNKYKCIQQWEANDIVAQFISILQHYDVPAANVTAQALLADNFQEISDSILSLEGQPVSFV
jgi:hypothetical protein